MPPQVLLLKIITFMGQKNNWISLINQGIALKQSYPDSELRRFREEYLTWTHTITSSPLGGQYKVKLHYDKNKGMSFYVLEPKPLPLAEGHKELPHVYSTVEQRLCLYYPDGTEWNPTMLYTKTIIPWAQEWLFYYELWVGSGDWQGGGKNHK